MHPTDRAPRAAAPRARPPTAVTGPHLSALRQGAGPRLAVAGAALAGLWLVVMWALA